MKLFVVPRLNRSVATGWRRGGTPPHTLESMFEASGEDHLITPEIKARLQALHQGDSTSTATVTATSAAQQPEASGAERIRGAFRVLIEARRACKRFAERAAAKRGLDVGCSQTSREEEGGADLCPSAECPLQCAAVETIDANTTSQGTDPEAASPVQPIHLLLSQAAHYRGSERTPGVAAADFASNDYRASDLNGLPTPSNDDVSEFSKKWRDTYFEIRMRHLQ